MPTARHRSHTGVSIRRAPATPPARHRRQPATLGVRHAHLALVLVPLLGVGTSTGHAVAPEQVAVSFPTITVPALVPAVAPAAPVTVTEPRRAVQVSRTTQRTGEVRAEDIPAVAMAAYTQAASVIGEVDETCGLDWSTLAGVGYVETLHGASDGSRLGRHGKARPALASAPQDGRQGRARVRDTDAGQYDGDRRWDRAVGPLMLLPTTWALAGVDADGDDRRDPQDIDDAALALAVLLCHGRGEMTGPALRDALTDHNAAPGYATRVLDAARGYRRTFAAMSEPDPVEVEVEEVPTETTGPVETPSPSQQPAPAGPGKPEKDPEPKQPPTVTPSTPPTTEPETPEEPETPPTVTPSTPPTTEPETPTTPTTTPPVPSPTTPTTTGEATP